MNWTPWDDGLATNGEAWGMFGTDLGDIDNDGWLDIASNSFGSGQGIHIYKNNQNGTWTQAYQYGSGNTGHYIQFGDIDGDGNLDFVASSIYGSAFFGNGNGTFTSKTTGLVPITAGRPYTDVSLADIDSDGDDDFIFTHFPTTGNSAVYAYKWNKTTQQWDNHSTGLPSAPQASEKYTAARAADIDMDGLADIILTSDALNEVQIYKGNGGTSWTKVYSLMMPQLTGAEDIAVGDIDHSGYPDVLVWGSFLGGGVFNPQTQNKIKMFRDKVVPTALTATVTYPKGSVCWKNNSVRFIKWVSAVPSNHSSSVKIEYSTTTNLGPWTLIAAAVPNNGTHQWTVPATVNSTDCFIRITVTDNVTSATAISTNINPFSMGCTTSVTSAEELSALNNVTVFPNPSSGMFNVKWLTDNGNTSTINHQPLSIEVKDVLGQKVKFNYSGTDKLSIDMRNNPDGIYFMTVKNNDHMQTVKLILEK
jgi:hypothetical protein